MNIETVAISCEYTIKYEGQADLFTGITVNRITNIEIKPSQYAKPDSALNLAMEIGTGLTLLYGNITTDELFSQIVGDTQRFLAQEFPHLGFVEKAVDHKKHIEHGVWTSGSACILLERDPLYCPSLAIPR